MSDTVRFGIDLGTTNSAIARMTDKGPEIIPVRRANYIPSAVAVDRRGDLKVGLDALNPQFVHARWFKRLMGTQNSTRLGDGGEWLPERLSAEVLKSLTAAARLKTGEEVGEAVITVPAMFNQPQCAATAEAARLAGLTAAALIQEPIAAATAYLSENPAEGDYLVYDLGGGTFDVSVVRLRGGEMNVLEHGGDNYLGGADFDRAVFDWTLDQIDRKGGDVSIFGSGAPKLQLFSMVEEARVALSDEERTTIYLDEYDLPLAKLEIDRATLEDLLSDLVSRSIELTKERMRVADNVRAVLLVGGPTQMPYVRRRLSAELDVPLAIEQDPMTAVAEGAAVHAGSLLRAAPVTPVAAVENAAKLQLFYEPVSPDPTCSVAGKVVEPGGMAGEVRLATTSGRWETGWISLRNGAFSTEVSLEKGLTEFRIELRDSLGRAIGCEPASFSVRSGIRAAQAVTPYDYSVVLEGGSGHRIIVKAGLPLPASGVAEFRLAKTLAAGSDDLAMMYFVEGNSRFVDENVKVGQLALRGKDISRTLREGERLEIRVEIDESRRLKATVFVPLLDEDFKVSLVSNIESPDYEDLVASLEEAKSTLERVEDHVEEDEQEILMQAGRRIEQIEATFERAERGEPGEAERIQKQLSDAKSDLRPLKEKYELIALHRSVVGLIEPSEDLCRHFEDPMGLAKLTDLREDADRALRLGSERNMTTVKDRVNDIFWPHFMRTRACWEEQIEILQDRTANASDRLSFLEHVHSAEQALALNDLQGCRLQVIRAWNLLPDQEKLRNRFHDAALRT